jgi:hypothetical protein
MSGRCIDSSQLGTQITADETECLKVRFFRLHTYADIYVPTASLVKILHRCTYKDLLLESSLYLIYQ